MKKLLLTFYVIGLCILLTDCKKKESDPVEEPEPTPAAPSQTTTPTPTVDPYTFVDETQSAKDLHEVMAILVDLNLMVGQLCEQNLAEMYFASAVSSTNGTMTLVFDQGAKFITGAFNKTLGKDGKTRDGAVMVNYGYHAVSNPNANVNAKFYHDFGYSAAIMPSEYSIDGWKVELFDPTKAAHVVNKVTSATYDPTQVDLSWEFSGKFKLTRLSDNKVVIWDGKILKTLLNTEDPQVFNVNKTQSIIWTNAMLGFTGTGTGDRFGETFTMDIGGTKAMVKNFTCSFAPSGTSATSFHPFVSGVTTFSLSNYHPRTIDYGPTNGCDNLTTVSFKDKKYTISLN